jgi:hypothetical protein
MNEQTNANAHTNAHTDTHTPGEILHQQDVGIILGDHTYLKEPRTPLYQDTPVVANYQGFGKWYPGTVSQAWGDGTYDIAYADGDFESRVEDRNIRIRQQDMPPEKNLTNFRTIGNNLI